MKIDYLFDTNILIYLTNNQLKEPLTKGIYACSVITEIELLSYPALTTEESDIIYQHLQAITIVGLTKAIKQRTIILRKKYRLKLPDAIIVSTALENNATSSGCIANKIFEYLEIKNKYIVLNKCPILRLVPNVYVGNVYLQALLDDKPSRA